MRDPLSAEFPDLKLLNLAADGDLHGAGRLQRGDTAAASPAAAAFGHD